MWITLAIIGALGLGAALFLNNPSFGSIPKGERRERMLRSENYREGSFRNQSVTPQLTSDKNFFQQLVGFLFRRIDGLRPETDIPVVRTDFKNLAPSQNLFVWLGHGSYYIQADGSNYLIDPVFYSASPVPFFNRAFRGTDIFKPGDFPDIDYLVITHDHWDHLDHRTVKELKPRIGMVICPLGVGAHFERWGFADDQLIELDWGQQAALTDGSLIHCLPARHFSGRGLKSNQSLWASYILQTPTRNIFMGGDGGYDKHFREIGSRFAPIDLAIVENGQYNEDWRYIHMLPQDLLKAIDDLGARRVMTVHNSKYALAKHPWDEPLRNISTAASRDSIDLLTPRIGEVVRLDDHRQQFDRWWE